MCALIWAHSLFVQVQGWSYKTVLLMEGSDLQKLFVAILVGSVALSILTSLHCG